MSDGNGTPYKPHPFSELFPLHDGPPMWELREDLRENGQRDPITLYQHKVLDGRRRQACMIGIDQEPRYETFDGTDEQALRFVISKNLKRRHLSESERAVIAAKMANLSSGQHKSDKEESKSASPIGEAPITRTQAAEALNVSPRSVDRAKVVEDKGTLALKRAVRIGKISVSDAANIATMPAKVQEQALADVAAKKAKTVTEAAPKPKKKPKAGKELFDDRVITDTLAKLTRLLNERSKHCGKSATFKIAWDHLEEFAKAWKLWQKEKA